MSSDTISTDDVPVVDILNVCYLLYTCRVQYMSLLLCNNWNVAVEYTMKNVKEGVWCMSPSFLLSGFSKQPSV